MGIQVLFEDNHLLIVEKPVNIPVQEDSSGDTDLLSLLKADIKQRYNKPGNVYLALLHRLDRPVGGVMIFAKTSKAASRMADEIRKQQMERYYFVVVRGKPRKNKGRLIHYLYKDKRKNQVYAVSEQHSKAKKAILTYESVKSLGSLTLLKVKLHTGRSHQIRVQLAEIGTPIYGDQKYGKGKNQPGEQIALWAAALTVRHPVKKAMLTIESNPPSLYPWNQFKINVSAHF